jgi:hypothetical protein
MHKEASEPLGASSAQAPPRTANFYHPEQSEASYTWVLPLLSAAYSIYVIHFLVEEAKRNGHISPFIRTPPISLAGIHAPEYYYFSAAFLSMAALLFHCEQEFWWRFSLHLPRSSPEVQALGLDSARSLVQLGFAGLGLTGPIPLQGWGVAGTLAHCAVSIAFFALSLNHGFVMVRALSADCLLQHPLHRRNAPWLWWAKAAALASSMASFLPAQLLHPGGTPQNPHAGGEEAADLDRGGFAQWWVVGSLVVYFALFSADMLALDRAREGKRGKE